MRVGVARKQDESLQEAQTNLSTFRPTVVLSAVTRAWAPSSSKMLKDKLSTDKQKVREKVRVWARCIIESTQNDRDLCESQRGLHAVVGSKQAGVARNVHSDSLELPERAVLGERPRKLTDTAVTQTCALQTVAVSDTHTHTHTHTHTKTHHQGHTRAW